MQTATLKLKYERYVKRKLIRKRYPISTRDENHITVDGAQCINFCSNDYLGLTQHPQVKKAYINAVNEFGVGSGASALVSGFFSVQQKAEQQLAEFLGRERAIIFNSGYHANIGAITSLANRHQTIISDKYCHASILDGVQLSRAKHYRYRHGDLNHMASLIKQKKPDWLITESVFSMEGDLTDLKKTTKLTKAHGVKLYLDDAHGVGVINNNFSDVDCLVTPLGKAFGCMGGVVSGADEMIESVLQFARTYRYTTALPPAIYAAISASLELIKKETWRANTLLQRIKFFNDQAALRELSLLSTELTPIRCIIVSEINKALQLQKQMQNRGFYVSCIRPPTVPLGLTRIRLSLNCLHTETQIEQLLDCLQDLL